MVDAGYLQEGQDPNAEQFANYMNRLNDVINFEQTQGLKLWLQYNLPVTLVAGQQTYTFGPTGGIVMNKPMRVLDSSFYSDSNQISRPLIPLSRDEFNRLSNPTQTGAINSFFVDKQQTQLAVSFWLVPDAQAATGSVTLLIQQQVTNLVSLTDTMNFPQEWFIFLRWALADDICTGQPKDIMDRCAGKYLFYREALEAWDVEDAATQFTPDQRSAYATGRFR